jgi:hypothetical protein
VRTCDAKASADGLVQEEQPILPVPLAGVVPQRHVCLQLEGTVQIEQAKQAAAARATLHPTNTKQTKARKSRVWASAASMLVIMLMLLLLLLLLQFQAGQQARVSCPTPYPCSLLSC